jgi:hypothetical protein
MTARISAMVGLRHSRWAFRLLLVLLVAAFAVAMMWRAGAGPAQAGKQYDVPRSSAIEAKLGIRITQASVVADGGLVELRYVVLDTGKATTFQNDVHHPPVLKSSKRTKEALYRTALMKQGHDLRPGQTYYILYMNNHNSVRPGETLQIDAGGVTLANVPVR